jgi:hypothetical protein
MTRRFAEGTDVSPEKSKLEIERTLERYGATSFASGWQGTVAVIVFECHGRRVKFSLTLPDRKDTKAKWARRGNDPYYGASESAVQSRYEQEVRRLWRCLALAIKAKLEVVESGIATFEEEFMAHVMLPNGATVGEWVEPQLEHAYRTGAMPPLLTAGKSS